MMTTYRCQCGEVHDNTDGHRCMVLYDHVTGATRFLKVSGLRFAAAEAGTPECLPVTGMADDDVAYWAQFATRRGEGWGPAQAAAIDACVELSARRASDLTNKEVAALGRLVDELRTWKEVRGHFASNHGAALRAIDKILNTRAARTEGK